MTDTRLTQAEYEARSVTIPAGESHCARCRETKPAAEFYKGNKANGLSSYCRDCSKDVARASVERFRQRAQARTEKVSVADRNGLCRGVLNLGAFEGIVHCTRAAVPGTGGYCMTHIRKELRPAARSLRAAITGERPWGSEAFRKRRAEQSAALLEAARVDPELAALLDEQAADARTFHVGGRWRVSLDSDRFDGNAWHESLGYGSGGLLGYTPDAWTDAVCAVVDRRREIDAWAEAA